MSGSAGGGRRRLVATVVAAVLAFVAGLGITLLLRHRDLERRDRRALTALEQELAVFPAPPGVETQEPQRGPLCCDDGKCPPHLTRRDAAAAGDLPAFYRRAFEREGWQPSRTEPSVEYFTKQVAGRPATASFVMTPDGTSSVRFALDPESC